MSSIHLLLSCPDTRFPEQSTGFAVITPAAARSLDIYHSLVFHIKRSGGWDWDSNNLFLHVSNEHDFLESHDLRPEE